MLIFMLILARLIKMQSKNSFLNLGINDNELDFFKLIFWLVPVQNNHRKLEKETQSVNLGGNGLHILLAFIGSRFVFGPKCVHRLKRGCKLSAMATFTHLY
jgi:hypothetical protein